LPVQTFSGDLRKNKTENLKREGLLTRKWEVIFKKIVEIENIVRECFVVGNKTVKHSKSYSNGGFVKE
jgi:hypothetical protein